MKKPSTSQAWAGVVIAALALLSSYLGLDKGGYINQPAEVTTTSTNTTTTVIEGGLSQQDVEAIVNKAIAAQVKIHTCGGRYHTC